MTQIRNNFYLNEIVARSKRLSAYYELYAILFLCSKSIRHCN